MQPYITEAAKVVRASQIAVQVLLSADGDDLQFWPLRPYAAVLTAPEDVVRRQLRIVGVVGISGTGPHVALCETLEPHIVQEIAAAFLTYIQTLLSPMAGHLQAVEVTELDRLYSLPDSRWN